MAFFQEQLLILFRVFLPSFYYGQVLTMPLMAKLPLENYFPFIPLLVILLDQLHSLLEPINQFKML